MSTLYQILGLPPGASEAQVKVAFRTLARRFHPDVSGADQAAEQRFKEINHAHATLADPKARARYDRALVCQRQESRRRFRRLAATATATCALTIGTVSLVVWWSEHLRAPQSVRSQAPGVESAAEPRTEQVTYRDDATVTPRPQEQRRGGSWTTYRNVPFSLALKYPTDVFAYDTGPTHDHSRTFLSRDGRALLRVFAAENIAGKSLANYRRSLIEERYAGVVLDHTRQGKFAFVLSGTRSDNVLYERVTFACGGKLIHGWQMIYPLSERTLYDLVADEIHRNYTPTDRAGVRCGRLGRERSRAAGPSH